MTSIVSGSGSSADDGTNAHFSLPAAAFSASTSVLSASSATPSTTREFSISSSPTTSASRSLIAVTILAC